METITKIDHNNCMQKYVTEGLKKENVRLSLIITELVQTQLNGQKIPDALWEDAHDVFMNVRENKSFCGKNEPDDMVKLFGNIGKGIVFEGEYKKVRSLAISLLSSLRRRCKETSPATEYVKCDSFVNDGMGHCAVAEEGQCNLYLSLLGADAFLHERAKQIFNPATYEREAE